MVFTPDTSIYLLSGVPLNNTYERTLFFNNSSEQFNYFNKYLLKKVTGATYQRANSNTIRVPFRPDELYTCNYLMFQNSAHGQKWFYAFVNEVNYINDVTSEIVYELDVMQTWFFDYTLQECLVEREHSSTDGVGDNILSEDLPTGEYVTTNTVEELAGSLTVWGLATEKIDNPTLVYVNPGTIGGFANACYLLPIALDIYSPEVSTVIQRVVSAYEKVGKLDSIVGFFTLPINWRNMDATPLTKYISAPARKMNYTPRNNKLLTFPYVSLACVADGVSTVMRYEFFNDYNTSPPTFMLQAGFGPNMSVSLTPLNYSGDAKCFDHQLIVNGFPMIPWKSSYFQNWWANRQSSVITDAISSGVSLVASSLIPGVGTALAVSQGASLFGKAVSTLGEAAHASIVPDKMHGNASATEINTATGNRGFRMYCRTIKGEYAAMIDDFFDMFGYKTMRVKVPNRNVRPCWCYTKTIGCTIKGNVPADVSKKICGIYDSGITFWKSSAEIGNYKQNNKV